MPGILNFLKDEPPRHKEIKFRIIVKFRSSTDLGMYITRLFSNYATLSFFSWACYEEEDFFEFCTWATPSGEEEDVLKIWKGELGERVIKIERM